MIFGVTHPQHWHSLNLRQNRNHYSFMGSFGSKSIQVVQQNFGGKMYYNTDVKLGTDLVSCFITKLAHTFII